MHEKRPASSVMLNPVEVFVV